MTAPQIAATPKSPPRLRRIPASVRDAVLDALSVANAQDLSDALTVDDLARAAIDAWEASAPVVEIGRHPGGGFYWQCWMGAEDCADGSPSSWYGWPHEEQAKTAAGFHLLTEHHGRGMK